MHILAVQGYAWGRGAYRLTGQALGVSTTTAYRWVSAHVLYGQYRAWGGELLPIVALFGVVRCSGVVGVDEKWVKVPKNDKPEGKHKKWMYVYLAVDVYTYDLLHVAIFPYLGSDSARAFLLELKAKGYKPRVIVTDLNRDYGEPVAQVNGIGSKIIPKTNNAVELVIRRFDQHYQNFCGFESIETARRFLAVFEMVYRFTPFAKDNKKDKERPPDQRIGGKCPLELAGYEVHELPIAQICRGQLLGWPTEVWKEIVPPQCSTMTSAYLINRSPPNAPPPA